MKVGICHNKRQRIEQSKENERETHQRKVSLGHFEFRNSSDFWGDNEFLFGIDISTSICNTNLYLSLLEYQQ